MSEKLYLSAQGLLEDSFRLGKKIIESGFKPTLIIAIWRGAAPIGIAVQEILGYAGIKSDHIAIRTSSYESGIDQRSRDIQVHGMSYLVRNACYEDRLLIVDDVFDTGHTINAVIEYLKVRTRRNTPKDIRVAVPYYKPTRSEVSRVPDYFIHETERWIKFPHSLEGLTEAEIKKYRPDIYQILYNRDSV
ncbi:MAG: hypoxanthine phosphoribosyltransferase [Gammaproteobacteria bacterium]|nr:hypoxanthine phosphoribosyltransferase [Gammaproteobacteria bacterium]